MLSLATSFKPKLTQGLIKLLELLFKIRNVLIGLGVTGLGCSLGYLLASPDLLLPTLSVLVILVALGVIVYQPLYGLLAWLMLDPFIETWIKIPMGAGLPDLSFARFTIAFLGIFMLAQGAIGKFRFARIGVTDICIVATTIGILISSPLAANPRGAVLYAISKHATPLVIFFFAKNLVQDRPKLHKMFWVIGLLGFVSAAYAIYEMTTGQIFFLQQDAVVSSLEGYTKNLKLIRGYIGSNDIARVLTSSIPISFYLFFENKNPLKKILLVGMIVVQVYGIFLTYNRASWYGLMISLTLIQFFYPQFRRLFLIIAAVAAVVLFLTWDRLNESDVVQDRINSKVSTYEDRNARWDAGYNMWLASPIRGWGLERYQYESGRFRTDGGRENFFAIENDYLEILVASGLLGFLPYFIFLITPLFNSLILYFKARAPDWPGFIKPETVTIYWAVFIPFALGGYTQILDDVIVKMIPFAVAGAVVGSHEYLIWGRKTQSPTLEVSTAAQPS